VADKPINKLSVFGSSTNRELNSSKIIDKQVTNKQSARKSPLSRMQTMILMARRRFKEIVGPTALQYSLNESNLKYGRYHYRLATMGRKYIKKQPSRLIKRLRFVRYQTSLVFVPRRRRYPARNRPNYTYIGRYNRARMRQLALRPRKALRRDRSKGWWRRAGLVRKLYYRYLVKKWRRMVRRIQPVTARLVRAYFSGASRRPKKGWRRTTIRNDYRSAVLGGVSTSTARRIGLIFVARDQLGLHIPSRYRLRPLKPVKAYRYRYTPVQVSRDSWNTWAFRLIQSNQASRRRQHTRKRTLRVVLYALKAVRGVARRIGSALRFDDGLRRWRRLKQDFYLHKVLNKLWLRNYMPVKRYRLHLSRKRRDSHRAYFAQWKESVAYRLLHTPLVRSRYDVEQLLARKQVFFNNRVLENSYEPLKGFGLFVRRDTQPGKVLRAFYQRSNTVHAARWRLARYFDTRKRKNRTSLFARDLMCRQRYWARNSADMAMQTHVFEEFLSETVEATYNYIRSNSPAIIVSPSLALHPRKQIRQSFVQPAEMRFVEKVKN